MGQKKALSKLKQWQGKASIVERYMLEKDDKFLRPKLAKGLFQMGRAYLIIGQIFHHLNGIMGKTIFVHKHWVSAKGICTAKSQRAQFNCDFKYSSTVSTAVKSFKKSGKKFAIFFPHCNTGHKSFHAWVLFYDKVNNNAILFNPSQDHVQTLPIVPSRIIQQLSARCTYSVFSGHQKKGNTNCVIRACMFAVALARRGLDLKLGLPYYPRLKK